LKAAFGRLFYWAVFFAAVSIFNSPAGLGLDFAFILAWDKFCVFFAQ